MNLAVKMVAEDGDTFTVGGYGLVWDGRDIFGERFTKSTDFWFDRITETPMVLYRHGLEAKMQRAVVGQVVSKKSDDVGLWIEAQIKDHEDYSAAIRKLVKSGVLGWSSGAVNHLVDKVKRAGYTEIRSWPIAEWSLVPDPCEPRTIGVSEIKSLSPELAEKLDSLKTLSESSDSAGGFTVSDNDAATVRDALSRFDQTTFESDAKKKSAARKIIARAHALNIDVANDSPAMLAAKALPDGATLMSDDEGGPYAEGSYEDLADDIAQALRRQTGEYAYVIATFPEYALVRCCDDDGMDMPGESSMAYFRVAYTLGADGEPVLGDMERVEPAMVPAGKALPIPQTDEAPLAIQSARLSEYAELVVDRTKAVSDRRIKEGRVLSVANRERLQTSTDALEEATKSLRDLLIEPTEPQAEAAAVARLSELALLKMWGDALSD